MKNRDDWGPKGPPELDDHEDVHENDPVRFTAMRRIELAARLHHMAFGAVLQASGLPPAQAGALKYIIHHPGLSQRELGDMLHIQRATCTVMLQKMEKAGYIDRRADPADQRVSRIYPTEDAMALDEENKKAFNAYFEHCFQDLSQEEFDAFMNSLSKVISTLRGMPKESAPDFPDKE